MLENLTRDNQQPSLRDEEGSETIPKGSTSKWMEVPAISNEMMI